MRALCPFYGMDRLFCESENVFLRTGDFREYSWTAADGIPRGVPYPGGFEGRMPFRPIGTEGLSPDGRRLRCSLRDGRRGMPPYRRTAVLAVSKADTDRFRRAFLRVRVRLDRPANMEGFGRIFAARNFAAAGNRGIVPLLRLFDAPACGAECQNWKRGFSGAVCSRWAASGKRSVFSGRNTCIAGAVRRR